MKKKILIIAYHFPPSGGAGVQRTLKFVKYLPLYDFEPIVLTVKKPSVPSYDSHLLDEVPSNIMIVRTRSLEFSYNHKQKIWQKFKATQENQKTNSIKKLLLGIVKYISYMLFIPDYQVGWIPFAVIASLKILRSHQIDSIFIIVPPFSSLLIGIILKVLTGKKWIADVRDEWLDFYNKFYEAHKRPFGSSILKKIERMTVQSAYIVTAVTKGIVQNFQNKYPNSSKRFIWMPNGFDPSDFLSDTIPNPIDKFTLTYTGTLFSVTTPKYFLLALSNLVSEFPEIRENLRVNFVGRIAEDILPLFDIPQLEGMLNITGYVSHEQSILYLLQSHVLILIIDDLPNSKNISTGKIFEYLFARKPILALTPEGDAADLIRQANAGFIIPPRDIKRIREQILQLYNDYKTGNLRFQPRTSFIYQFDRRTITEEFVNKILGE